MADFVICVSEICGKFYSGQKPTFVFHLYSKINYFSHNSVKKKWESGQKCRKPLYINGFSLPTFQKFLAICPLFLGFFRFFHRFVKRPEKTVRKSGQKFLDFLSSEKISGKSGLKKGRFFDLPKSCFFRGWTSFSPSVPCLTLCLPKTS